MERKGSDQTVVITGQHVTNSNELALCLLTHLLQYSRTGCLSSVGAREQAAPKVSTHDLVVIAVADG